MKLFFWKGKEEVNGAYAPYEEIDAKRTSKLGYFFLILMVLFGIWQGNLLLNEIEDSIDRPVANSSCSAKLASVIDSSFYLATYYENYYYEDIQGCNFSAREIAAGLDQVYAKAEPLFTEIQGYAEQIRILENQSITTQRAKEKTLDEYEAALLEDISATEFGRLDSEELGQGFVSQKQSIAQIEAQKQEVEIRKQKTEQKLVNLITPYRPQLEKVQSEYEFDLKKYEFFIFVVSLILVAPLFFFVWRRYHLARRNRSEYTIIWGGAVATFGFILAQVLLVFVYEILPKKIIEALFSFLATFEFIWTILYYLSFVLVPLFFGFLIYLIQKKLYNKHAVFMRTIKSGHCPGCSLKITPDMNHCPICGYKIKSQCPTCGQMTLEGGNFCSVCGSGRTNGS